MTKKVEILHREYVFHKAFFRIESVRLRHEQVDGSMSEEMVRLNFKTGDSVAAVVHDVEQNRIILVEQFRYPTYEKTGGWLIEIPAGRVEEGEDPADTICREIEEEIGYRTDSAEFVSTFYLSPGALSERIHLYYVPVRSANKVSDGGGLATENEDIRLIFLDSREAKEAIFTGKIQDAKTIIALQWLELNRA